MMVKDHTQSDERRRWHQLSLVNRLTFVWLLLSLGLVLSLMVFGILSPTFVGHLIMLSRQYEVLTFLPILIFAILWSVAFISLAHRQDVADHSLTKRWHVEKRFMKYAVLLPVYAGIFGYLPLAIALPNWLNYIFGQPFEETVVVSEFYKHYGKGGTHCQYQIYVREFRSFTRSSFCILERPQLGDSVFISGKRSWLGINIISYSYFPKNSGSL